MDWKRFILESQANAETRIRQLVLKGVNPFSTSTKLKTLLHAAVITNDISIARLAIAYGVSVNSRANSFKTAGHKRTQLWTPLFYAIRDGHADMVRLLLDNGATTDATYQGETPMSLAIRKRCEDVFWVLIEFSLTSLPDPKRWLGCWSWYDSTLMQEMSELHAGRIPERVCLQIVWNKPPDRHMSFLENRLLQPFDINGTREDTNEYCIRCSSGLSHQDVDTAEIWKRKAEMIRRWMPSENAFDYGFRKRCRICKASLESVDPKFAAPASARGVIAPWEAAFLSIQPRNREEDFLQILELRRSLPSPDRMTSQNRLLLPMYWLLRCLKSHKQCIRDQEEVLLPKRLIALDESRLIETHAGQRGSYCTLSYRWTEPAITLRRNNIDNFKHAIPIKELSQTIQHAITVAQGLGFKYMWVDALCILQDLDQDWLDQAAEMDKTYHFSSLTIAMVDSDEHWRTDYRPFHMPREADKEQHLWRHGGELDTRGWTLQEFVLSRRTLSITRTGIYWTCSCWNCSENYPAGIPADKERYWRQATIKNTLNMRSNRHRVNFPDLQGWAAQSARSTSGYELWQRLVEDFTCREFTFQSHKLAAIEGITKFLAPFLDNDKCFAGVWRKNFQEDLLWFSNGYMGIVDAASLTTLSGFPSWSWASVGRTVEYPQGYGSPYWAKVELLDIELNTHDRGQHFGQVVLKGTLLPITIRTTIRRQSPLVQAYSMEFIPEDDSSMDDCRSRGYKPGGWPIDRQYLDIVDRYCEDDRPSWRGSFRLDHRPGVPMPTVAFILHLGCGGLVIAPTDRVDAQGSTVYRRIGMCEWGGDMGKTLACDFSKGAALEHLQTAVIIQ